SVALCPWCCKMLALYRQAQADDTTTERRLTPIAHVHIWDKRRLALKVAHTVLDSPQPLAERCPLLHQINELPSSRIHVAAFVELLHKGQRNRRDSLTRN